MIPLLQLIENEVWPSWNLQTTVSKADSFCPETNIFVDSIQAKYLNFIYLAIWHYSDQLITVWRGSLCGISFRWSKIKEWIEKLKKIIGAGKEY
jgi:hypothetical protein